MKIATIKHCRTILPAVVISIILNGCATCEKRVQVSERHLVAPSLPAEQTSSHW
jgi:hypothetical protein